MTCTTSSGTTARGPADVARRFAPLNSRPEAAEGLEILRRDFMEPEAVGPRRAAAFATGGVDEAVQVEVVGFVTEFLRLVERGEPIRPWPTFVRWLRDRRALLALLVIPGWPAMKARHAVD